MRFGSELGSICVRNLTAASVHSNIESRSHATFGSAMEGQTSRSRPMRTALVLNPASTATRLHASAAGRCLLMSLPSGTVRRFQKLLTEVTTTLYERLRLLKVHKPHAGSSPIPSAGFLQPQPGRMRTWAVVPFSMCAQYVLSMSLADLGKRLRTQTGFDRS